MNLTDLKGVGEKLNKTLKDKGITNIKSLLYTFPKGYDVYKISGFNKDMPFMANAVITSECKETKGSTFTRITFEVMIDDLIYSCVCFNMKYLVKMLKIGKEVVISGKYQKDFNSILIDKVIDKSQYKDGIYPLYNIDGVSNLTLNKIIKEAFKYYVERESVIPSFYFEKYGYKTGKDLYLGIHFPKTIEDIERAKASLKYSELLSFMIKMEITRSKMKSFKKNPIKYDILEIRKFVKENVSFKLTTDQVNAINEIFKYFNSDTPMNMLLEGDVGSGKTIVAIIASFAIYTSNKKTMVLAPTEALAFQHYNTFKEFFKNTNCKIEVLTSSISSKGRKELIEKINNDEVDILIGTHSLLNDEISLNNLGFVVCDEQHKFGVKQRNKIREKGNNPDCLYMTATPIPRTLALTIFNDMKLVSIKSMPSDRKKTKTYVHTYKDYKKVLEFVESEIKDKRQAYFVASCIEENGQSELVSVNRIKDDLVKFFKGKYRIGLLHGKMDSKEKDEVISLFMNKELDILVSTTVIEVGINNPNASIMVVIDAHQFGLSTLHQLRGRVGRGSDQGYAFLMVNNKEYIDKLKILEETNDGFIISEEDLRQRGPGDFLGENQSGLLKFKFANIFYDKRILNDAINDAKILVRDYNVYSFFEKKLESDVLN